MPLRRPSTMWRARISNRPIRLITSGCKDLLEAVVMNKLVFVRRSDFEQAVDDVIGIDAIAFGGKIHHDAMAKHRFGERANIFERHMRTTMNKRAGLGPEN